MIEIERKSFKTEFKPGIYFNGDPEYIYEIIQNTDINWLHEDPDAKYLVDTWELIKTDKNKSIYKTQGSLVPLQNFDTSNIRQLSLNSSKLIDKMGLKLIIVSE